MSVIEQAFDDYQSFTATTAVYPQAVAGSYLGLGLGDEAGELLEKILEGVRLSDDEMRSILAECGDVMWYLAQMMRVRRVPLSHIYLLPHTLSFEATLLGAAHAVVLSATRIQGRLKKELRDDIDASLAINQHASMIIRGIDAIARALGNNVLLVMASNREKLEGRRESGTLKGEGDNR